MTKENVISAESFHRWKKDPVTQEVMKYLQRVRYDVELDMLDKRVILAEGGLIKYSGAVGIRDGVDRVLEIQIEDIIEDDNNGDELGTSGA